MNNLRYVLLLIAVSLACMAQTPNIAPANPAALPPPVAARPSLPKSVGPTAPVIFRVGAWLDQLNNTVHLTADQKVKMRSIAIHEQEEILAIKRRASSQIQNLLTPDQQKALRDIASKHLANLRAANTPATTVAPVLPTPGK